MSNGSFTLLSEIRDKIFELRTEILDRLFIIKEKRLSQTELEKREVFEERILENIIKIEREILEGLKDFETKILDKVTIFEKIESKKIYLERKKENIQIRKKEKNVDGWAFIPHSSGEFIHKDDRIIVWNRDKEQCINCGSVENLQFNHKVHISKGGTTTPDNLEILCKECLIKKSNRY